ncbi:hypothetical protein HU200_056606 [Digitaria exilis]|uniref:Uncharacterized protein n=1 Tax=Digitaria exilis TaxID=1010633 RepID=A0A835E0Q9_9POAL|nr:hypothetical protein HU200_056606 [Digitaria exilis]
MERKMSLTLLVLLGVLLGLTNRVAGGMKATVAGGSTESWSGEAAAFGRLMSTRLEDDVAPELTLDMEVHRRILANNIGPSVLNAKKASLSALLRWPRAAIYQSGMPKDLPVPRRLMEPTLPEIYLP